LTDTNKQTKHCRKIHKLNTTLEKQTTQNIQNKTKQPCFSCLLQHSARKWDGLILLWSWVTQGTNARLQWQKMTWNFYKKPSCR